MISYTELDEEWGQVTSPDMPAAWSHLLYLTTAPNVVAVACRGGHPQTRIPPLHFLSILLTGNPQTIPGIAHLDPVAVSLWQSLRHASPSQRKYLA